MMDRAEHIAKILKQLGLEADTGDAVGDLFDSWLLEAQAKANRKDTPDALLAIVRDIVVAAYHRRGDEGATSSSVGGQSYSYAELSAQLQSRVVQANLRVFRP